MSADLWSLIAVTVFYLSVQICLMRGNPRELDEASMLPFADDPEVARRVERETGRRVVPQKSVIKEADDHYYRQF